MLHQHLDGHVISTVKKHHVFIRYQKASQLNLLADIKYSTVDAFFIFCMNTNSLIQEPHPVQIVSNPLLYVI